MKKTILIFSLLLLVASQVVYAGLFDNLFKAPSAQTSGSDDSTVVSGLKEALSIGTDNAVKSVSKVDGYFANEAIKIIMPEKLKTVADVLKNVGYRKEVDDFELSMNRAAEKAAPKATSYFVGAIKEMTFEDARKILQGGNTSATEFFERKTRDRLYGEFKPVVSSSMNDVGVTRSYKDMMKKYDSVPFVEKKSLDLDHYVTDKALAGLFHMIGEEEKKIRTDPAARVTDLLKKVFGS